jgi:hypothetical protein
MFRSKGLDVDQFMRACPVTHSVWHRFTDADFDKYSYLNIDRDIRDCLAT